MNIIGPDALVFGVDDVASCTQYLIDYGLLAKDVSATGGQFVALDGSYIELRQRDDSSLPAALATGSVLRKTVYGVADQQALQQIAAELSKDREVKQLTDGSIEAVDDMGFVLGFQLTVRKALQLPNEIINAPGATLNRGVNAVGANEDAEIIPRSLSHVVYFVPDQKKAEAFYVERLGFRVTDRFTNLGPFLRPEGTLDHHTLFMIETPPQMQGIEHFTFHVGSPNDLLLAGKRFQDKGYESFWGPGRHVYGSNWFWYFNSPMGVHVEYDADMDLHDEDWTPRAIESSADSSQIFNFTLADKWMPGGGPH
jgi:catechol 2,3-dioxygenase-like lactoylglutathione lyase family enzyme